MNEDEARFLRLFGERFNLETEADKAQFLASAYYRRLEAGAYLLRAGESCGAVPFVLSGSLRVFKTGESGREISLYRIGPGETCILSCCCAEHRGRFPAAVLAEEDTSAAFLRGEALESLFAHSPRFRSFVLSQYASRMAEVIELVEEVAFRHLDARLKELLTAMRETQGGQTVRATHQELADHLGTSREVVSRILKDWEDRGAIALSRGEIALLSPFEALPV
jgi:CRP/FNR family transcriptional regulator, anaerobic regulatory protein